MEHLLLGTHLISLQIELDFQRVDKILLGFYLNLIFGFEFEDAFHRLVLVSLLFGYGLFFEGLELSIEILSLKFIINNFLLLLLLPQVGLNFILARNFESLLLLQ